MSGLKKKSFYILYIYAESEMSGTFIPGLYNTKMKKFYTFIF